jgi:hypothetical protein
MQDSKQQHRLAKTSERPSVQTAHVPDRRSNRYLCLRRGGGGGGGGGRKPEKRHCFPDEINGSLQLLRVERRCCCLPAGGCRSYGHSLMHCTRNSSSIRSALQYTRVPFANQTHATKHFRRPPDTSRVTSVPTQRMKKRRTRLDGRWPAAKRWANALGARARGTAPATYAVRRRAAQVGYGLPTAS